MTEGRWSPPPRRDRPIDWRPVRTSGGRASPVAARARLVVDVDPLEI
jgi:hypothetical protein